MSEPPTSVSEQGAAPGRPQRQSFAALRHPHYRRYFVATSLAMMGDSTEHVISYWMIFQKFHSPALGGFAILSHWLPFLFFGVLSGALADRYDPRRMIQFGMFLFACCSLAWGVLFLTDSLQMWHAIVILTVHGFAGVFWGTPGQVLLHDMVGIETLPSAVRLNSTGRYLGLLAGPAVGGAVMMALGPAHGILLNICSFLPLVLLMWKAPYGPAFRKEKRPPRPIRGYADVFGSIESIRGNRVIISIMLLASCSAFFVANGYQSQMPEFAQDLGHGDAGFFYSLLLGANALGALVAGFALEASGWLQPKPLTPFMLLMLWCSSLIGFALTNSYPVAVILMLITGFVGLAYDSMNQTLVQLNAPPAIRGRVVGLYNMFAQGLRAFSGITIGVGGSVIGVHWSLALSATILLMLAVLLLFLVRPSLAAAEGTG
jgi:MFS family permease